MKFITTKKISTEWIAYEIVFPKKYKGCWHNEFGAAFWFRDKPPSQSVEKWWSLLSMPYFKAHMM